MAEFALESPQAQTAPRLRLSLETLAYVALLVLALGLRFTQLEAVPLSAEEAREALPAYQQMFITASDAPSLFPLNSIGALFNRLGLLFFSGSDFGARFSTVMAGILLTFSPLLFRAYIGRLAALMLSLGLLLSPVLLLASRSMSGLVWALLLLMIGLWLSLRFAEGRRRGDAIAASICAGGVVFLSTPYGILILMGVLFGLLYATYGHADLRRRLRETFAAWPKGESVIAVMLAAIVISTAFFTQPNGLSSLGALWEVFVSGLTQRPDDQTAFFPLLVSLRYELIFSLFAFGGLIAIRGDSSPAERFLAFAFGWAWFCAAFYQGGGADLALLITLPALGLGLSWIFRLIQTTRYGFWEVPFWAIPLHALVVAALLASVAVNFRSISDKLYTEAQIVSYAKVLDLSGANGTNVRIGTLQSGAEGSSMAATLPLLRLRNCDSELGDRDPAIIYQTVEGLYCDRAPSSLVTALVYPIDKAAADADFFLRGTVGETLRTEKLGDGLKFVFDAQTEGEYRFDLIRAPDQALDIQAQYGVVLLEGDHLNPSGLSSITSAIWTRAPQLYSFFQISTRAPNIPAFGVLLVLLLILIPLTFFLVGAFYGARAAQRGLIFGLLLFGSINSLGIGWTGAVVYGGDPRELWYSSAVGEDYQNIESILITFSRRYNGTDYLIPITVQAEADGALAWGLRRFVNARFSPNLPPTTNSPALITPDTLPRPTLGADYVGQQLAFSYTWSPSDLAWVDMGAWLMARNVRYSPRLEQPYRVWIEKTLYDVVNVPEG